MEDLIPLPLPSLKTQKKKPGKGNMVFTIKMHQPSLADYIYGGKAVVTWSNITPECPPQAFRQSPVVSLKVFLRSIRSGGRKTLLTAVQDFVLPLCQVPYLSCLWIFSGVGQSCPHVAFAFCLCKTWQAESCVQVYLTLCLIIMAAH